MTIRWTVLISLVLASPLAATTPQPQPNATPAVDALGKIAGQWRIVDVGKGEVVNDCKTAQPITVSADRRHVLFGAEGSEYFTRYIVVHVEADRMLMFIEGETRKTEQGDPVLWWADFKTENSFRWRRYDWSKDAKTYGEWQRCGVE